MVGSLKDVAVLQDGLVLIPQCTPLRGSSSIAISASIVYTEGTEGEPRVLWGNVSNFSRAHEFLGLAYKLPGCIAFRWRLARV